MKILKKLLKGSLVVVLLFTSWLALRNAAWAEMVAAQYMMAHYETTRCNKFLAAHYDQELVKRNRPALKNMVNPICPFDEQACDKADDMWKKYEENRVKYRNYQWGEFFERMWNRSILGKTE